MIPLEKLQALNKDTLMEALGIEYTEVGDGFLCGKMPVDGRTKQPAGLLHGGATAALAETLGSLGSVLLVDMNEFNVVGIEISANHIKSATSGWVYGKAEIVHKGKTLHVWNIDVTNEEGKLISTCRLTNMIIAKKK